MIELKSLETKKLFRFIKLNIKEVEELPVGIEILDIGLENKILITAIILGIITLSVGLE